MQPKEYFEQQRDSWRPLVKDNFRHHIIREYKYFCILKLYACHIQFYMWNKITSLPKSLWPPLIQWSKSTDYEIILPCPHNTELNLSLLKYSTRQDIACLYDLSWLSGVTWYVVKLPIASRYPLRHETPTTKWVLLNSSIPSHFLLSLDILNDSPLISHTFSSL